MDIYQICPARRFLHPQHLSTCTQVPDFTPPSNHHPTKIIDRPKSSITIPNLTQTDWFRVSKHRLSLPWPPNRVTRNLPITFHYLPFANHHNANIHLVPPNGLLLLLCPIKNRESRGYPPASPTAKIHSPEQDAMSSYWAYYVLLCGT